MHVQCTCKCFVPFVLLPLLQAKRKAPPVPNLQVTRILPHSVCFSGCRSCRVQAARARTEKLFKRGPPVLGKFELATPNLVHCWSSMYVIRWYIAFGDEMRSPRA